MIKPLWFFDQIPEPTIYKMVNGEHAHYVLFCKLYFVGSEKKSKLEPGTDLHKLVNVYYQKQSITNRL